MQFDPEAGSVRRMADASATFGHIVPAAITFHGNFYFANLNLLQVQTGSPLIFKVTPSGQIQADVPKVRWAGALRKAE